MQNLKEVKMKESDFSSWPSYTYEEAQAVKNILLSNKVNYWTGREGSLFEREFAEWVEVDHAIAVSNGTVALELALRGLGIGPGDDVIVTPRTFIASVSCVVNVGATPVFADVDRESGNITAETISKVITPRSKAIVCVHLAGWPCEMEPIMDLAEERGLFVIEDCAQAHGATYKGRSVGSIGHVGAWSFCQDKIMTTGGEGGMVTTNDPALWSAMWSYKDHGKNWDAVYNQVHPPGFRWLHESFGTNWRMTEMQAAIGRIQLKKMKEWSNLRRRNASILDDCFYPLFKRGVIRLPHLKYKRLGHAWYKYYLYIDPSQLKSGWNRDRIIYEINSEGIPCFYGSCSEVYLEKAFKDKPYRPKNRLPVAKEMGETSIMFLVHPTLTEYEMKQIGSVACKVISNAMER